MNRLTAILLMLCLSCQLVLKLSIVAWFEINQEYIAATLCENKAKPELVCCGKCVLTKQLKKADDTEQKDKKNAQEKVERTATVVFILPAAPATQVDFRELLSAVQHPVLPNLFDVAVQHAIFHPPAIIYS